MTEEKYQYLVKKTSSKYYTEVDLDEWHDYDVKVAKEEGIKQGIKQGMSQCMKSDITKGKIEVIMYLIKEKYGEDASWLYECTSEQLDKVMSLYISNADYQTLMDIKNSHS